MNNNKNELVEPDLGECFFAEEWLIKYLTQDEIKELNLLSRETFKIVHVTFSEALWYRFKYFHRKLTDEEINRWTEVNQRVIKVIIKENKENKENKDYINSPLEFAEWININGIRDGEHEWIYKVDNYKKKFSTKEMYEFFIKNNI